MTPETTNTNIPTCGFPATETPNVTHQVSAHISSAAPDVVQSFFTASEFPVDELGRVLSRACQEIAQCYNVPADVVALAMLVISAGCYGPRARLVTPHHSFPGHLLAVCSAPPMSNMALALERVTAKVRAFQQTHLKDADDPEIEGQIAELRSIKPCRQEPWQSAKLLNLQGKLAPEFLVEDLSRRELTRALGTSLDGGMLHVATGPYSLPDLRGISSSSRKSLELIGRLLRGSPMRVTNRNRHAFPVEWTSLSSFVLMSHPELTELMPTLHPMEGAIVFQSEASAKQLDLNAMCQRLRGLEAWEHCLCKNLGRRTTGEELPPVGASAEALGRLSEFQGEILRLQPEVPPAASDHIARLPDLARRLYIALAVANDLPGKRNCLAPTAVRLARWYGRKQLETWLSLQQQLGKPSVSAPLLEVLVRIRRFNAPVTRRQLSRTFHSQRRDTLDPLVEQLVASGQVLEDAQGRLLPALSPAAANGPLPDGNDRPV